MHGEDKKGQICYYNKDKFLTQVFPPFPENQVVSLPRAADKTSWLKRNQILKCSQGKHVSAKVTKTSKYYFSDTKPIVYFELQPHGNGRHSMGTAQ